MNQPNEPSLTAMKCIVARRRRNLEDRAKAQTIADTIPGLDHVIGLDTDAILVMLKEFGVKEPDKQTIEMITKMERDW